MASKAAYNLPLFIVKFAPKRHAICSTEAMLPKKVSSDSEQFPIYLIRGERVMLDEDLAKLYGASTMRLNEQVRRNIERFPSDLMFSLTNQEFTILISQFAISSSAWGGRRKPPLAFTEQGIAMLSSVLKSDRAVSTNIAIMRAFVKMRSVPTLNQEVEK